VMGMDRHALGTVAFPTRHAFLVRLAAGGGPGCPRERWRW
jgi:hypothetical protein